MIGELERAFIKRVTLPSIFPERCKRCHHYSWAYFFEDEYVNGDFCIRFRDWSEHNKFSFEDLETCGGFCKREGDRVYLHEYAPMILDVERMF
jgi:hypothetical protein